MEVNHSPFSDFCSFFEALFVKEPEAWQVLNREYGRLLFKYLMSSGLDEDLAQDLVQNVYLHLFQKSEGNKPQINSPFGLLSYFRNLALNLFRQEQLKRGFVLVSLEGVSSQEHQQIDLFDLIAGSTIISDELTEVYLNALQKFISGLRKPKHQEVVRLHFIDCLNPREISDRTGENPENVRKIILRTRKRLVAHLQEVMLAHLAKETQ